jgi:Polyketide cyclase / dehydrase and lipid transport
MSTSDVETVERFIPAPAAAIFALLADPARHHEIDGSRTVVKPKGPVSRLTLGSKFGMSMKWGFPYSMVNTVIEYESNRRIAWQTRPPGIVARFLGGRIWRYELEPVEGGTMVRESWDITQEAIKAMVRPLRGQTRTSMEQTLEIIEGLVAKKS